MTMPLQMASFLFSAIVSATCIRIIGAKQSVTVLRKLGKMGGSCSDLCAATGSSCNADALGELSAEHMKTFYEMNYDNDCSSVTFDNTASVQDRIGTDPPTVKIQSGDVECHFQQNETMDPIDCETKLEDVQNARAFLCVCQNYDCPVGQKVGNKCLFSATPNNEISVNAEFDCFHQNFGEVVVVSSQVELSLIKDYVRNKLGYDDNFPIVLMPDIVEGVVWEHQGSLRDGELYIGGQIPGGLFEGRNRFLVYGEKILELEDEEVVIPPNYTKVICQHSPTFYMPKLVEPPEKGWGKMFEQATWNGQIVSPNLSKAILKNVSIPVRNSAGKLKCGIECGREENCAGFNWDPASNESCVLFSHSINYIISAMGIENLVVSSQSSDAVFFFNGEVGECINCRCRMCWRYEESPDYSY